MSTTMPEARGQTAKVEPHLVQFYESDEFLAGAVIEFLAEGVRRGDPILLAVTPKHRHLFGERLSELGLDVVGAEVAGRIVVIDAADTLRSFMTPAGPDARLFEQRVGSRVVELIERHPGRRLRAFGEMVDLLWRDGNTSAAVQLEELWNGLQRRHAFSLFCAYVVGSSLNAHAAGAVAEPHTHVLPSEPSASGVAMRLAVEVAQRREMDQALREALKQQQLLFALAQNVIRAQRVDEIFPPTLEAIEGALGANRSAVLLYDEEGVLRFRASRGLSDAYRAAVEGHSPWPRDATDPRVVWVGDAASDPSLAEYRELFARERIGALGFIPLVASGRLLGKFMVYYERPRVLAPRELELAQAIANHIAAATARFQALDELQSTVRFNEMFTAILGHDLRNPLGAIMTAAQLLTKRTDNEKLLRPLGRIMSSGDRMARMIDQLLDFTRVRIGAGLPLTPERCDLRPLLDQVIEELEVQHPEAGIVLECAGDTVGQWDGDRLGQVFSNLLGNAIEHGTGPRIDVRVDGTAPGRLVATVRNAGAVAGERLPRLFEPMTGRDRRGEKSAGLGLGLYITREVARAHGGDISVESSEAAGTTFRMELPRSGS